LGDAAEAAVAARLSGLGWSILGSGVHVERDELDLIALEPGDPPVLVFVEVRSHSVTRFGTPEESVSAAKVARLYRAAMGLLRLGRLPDGTVLPPLAWRVDLVAVQVADDATGADGGPVRYAFRHLRGLAAP
jgi:putative endonuclease